MFLGPFWVRICIPLGLVGRASQRTKATTPRQANRNLDSNLCTVVCESSAFPVCCSAITSETVYPPPRMHFNFTSLGLKLSFRFLNKLKTGGRAGPIASTGASPGPGHRGGTWCVPRWFSLRLGCACYCWPRSATPLTLSCHRGMEGLGERRGLEGGRQAPPLPMHPWSAG